MGALVKWATPVPPGPRKAGHWVSVASHLGYVFSAGVGASVVASSILRPGAGGQGYQFLSQSFGITLDPGDTYTFMRTISPIDALFTPGSHTIDVDADFSGLEAESDETNNELRITFDVVAALPDLVVSDIRVLTTPVFEGGDMTIEFDVTNQGNVPTAHGSVFASSILRYCPWNVSLSSIR